MNTFSVTNMGCLKLTYHTTGGSLDVTAENFLRVIGKKGQAEKKCLDYYPFGSTLPGRNYNQNDYKYAFNGMEKDDEVKGSGNHYTTLFRQYDPRLGRWMSLDPKMHKYSGISPYAAYLNNPIYYTDPLGDEPPEAEKKKIKSGTKKALKQLAQKQAEIAFNQSVTPAYESEPDPVDLYDTDVNSKIDIPASDKFYGLDNSKDFKGKVGIDDNDQIESDIHFYAGNSDEVNTIRDIQFVGKMADMGTNSAGYFVRFSAANNREVAHYKFDSQEKYKKFVNQYSIQVRRNILKVAKEYDVQNGTNHHARWKSYFDQTKKAY